MPFLFTTLPRLAERCCSFADNENYEEQIRSLQTQLEEMRRWNASLQTRLQQQPTNQRGGGVGGAKDSPLKHPELPSHSQLSSANSSFMYNTYGELSAAWYLFAQSQSKSIYCEFVEAGRGKFLLSQTENCQKVRLGLRRAMLFDLFSLAIRIAVCRVFVVLSSGCDFEMILPPAIRHVARVVFVF